jgi:transcriptional regulator with XRE-family HTH domain
MSQIDIQANGRFAVALKAAVEESGMSLADLGEKVDGSYEHLRKLIAGKAYPSLHLLRILATTLKADKEKWSELIEADKLYAKYKHLPKFLKQSGDLEKFQPIIPQLSKAGQEMLLQVAKTLLRQEKTQHQ